MSRISGPRDDLSYDIFKPIRIVLHGLGDAEWAFSVWCELSFRAILPGISLEPPNQVIGLKATFLEL